MASILRSGGASSKLVCGFYPCGNFPAAPHGYSAAIGLKDRAHELKTTDSLRIFTINSVSRGIYAKKPVAVTTQRFAHTDVQFPNFDSYRLDSTKYPHKKASVSEDDRRGTPHSIIYGVGGMLALYTAKEVVQKIVAYKGMARDKLALASIEVNLNEIPEGKVKTYEWRGKPVFVHHRSPKQVERERSVNVADLRHPETDQERVKRDEWSILIGVCTHLGCVPIAGAGDFGGYYCPCHGSHYDGSGRIRKGPAPLNLNIPPYSFKDNVVVIGAS